MNTIEELQKLCDEMRKANNALAPPPLLVRQRWASTVQSIIDRMNADEQAIVEEVKKRWPQGKPQPDDTFVGAAPQVSDGMVLVPEVLLRQISKWLAEFADPYDKAAYAINGLIAAAKEEG